MAYLKFKADQLFTGTTITTNDNVLITNLQGVIQDIIPTQDAGDDVQVLQGMLSPGFINCHCHLELSHMKGLIPEATGLVDFVFKVVTQRHFTQDEILQAIQNGEDEMISNGIVAVGDICNNTLTLSQKQQQRIAYYNFIEVSGWLPSIAQQRFDASKNYYNAFNEVFANTAFAAHAPYSVSNELWNLMQPYFANKTTTIHNQETSFEDELFINGKGDFLRMYQVMKLDNSFFATSGKSSLTTIANKLSNAKNVLLVHNTFTKQADVAYIKQLAAENNNNYYFCICINANNYIEQSVPPIDMFYQQQCDIVIGTDSLASNHSLSVLDEMKTIIQHNPAIPQEEILQWATINGAKALQMNDVLGSFEKGKQPGVVLIDNLEDGKISNQSQVKRLV